MRVANCPLEYVPAPDLEDALHGVLAEPKQIRHRSVAERWVLLDHRLDRFGKLRIDFGFGVIHLVVKGAPRNVELATQPAHTGNHAIIAQALMRAKDHFPCWSSKACCFFRARNSSNASP